jgi:ABC-2 type transport system ATP-binding protein
MDEAERCHRLAILDRGRLVADGTPAELTGRLAGRTFAVHAAQPRKAQKVLLGLPGAPSVAQIGNTLRVLAPQADFDAAAVARVLRDAGLEADVEAVAPNLEDVFVAATRSDTRPREAAA